MHKDGVMARTHCISIDKDDRIQSSSSSEPSVCKVCGGTLFMPVAIWSGHSYK